MLCVRLNRAEIFGGKGSGNERSEGEEWRAWGGTCVSVVLENGWMIEWMRRLSGETVHLGDESVERRGEVASRAWG